MDVIEKLENGNVRLTGIVSNFTFAELSTVTVEGRYVRVSTAGTPLYDIPAYVDYEVKTIGQTNVYRRQQGAAALALLLQNTVFAPAPAGVAVLVSDTLYDSDNQFAIAADTAMQIPNNGMVNANGFLPLNKDPNNGLLVDENGRLLALSPNFDNYLMRVNFRANPTLNNREAEFLVTIGEGVRIHGETIKLTRRNVRDSYSSAVFPFFTGQTFFETGANLTLNIDGICSIYDISYYIKQLT